MIKATLSLFALLATPATAWPTGAGACPNGTAAVFQSHVDPSKAVTVGTLADAPQMIKVHLNGEDLMDGSTVVMGESAEIKLAADMPFKGFLIRMGPVDDMMMDGDMDLTMALNPLEGATDVKLEEGYCIPSGVAGVCHTGREEKTEIMATLEAPEAKEYMMDITVVIANNAEVSEYYHTTYMIEAVSDGMGTDPTPTDAPETDTDSGSAIMSIQFAFVALFAALFM